MNLLISYQLLLYYNVLKKSQKLPLQNNCNYAITINSANYISQ